MPGAKNYKMNRKKVQAHKVKHYVRTSKICTPRVRRKYNLTDEERKALWVRLLQNQCIETSDEEITFSSSNDKDNTRDAFIGMANADDNEYSKSLFEESSITEKVCLKSVAIPKTPNDSQIKSDDNDSPQVKTTYEENLYNGSLTRVLKHSNSVDQIPGQAKSSPKKTHKLKLIQKCDTQINLTKEDLIEYAYTRKRSPPWKRDKCTPLYDHIKRRLRPQDDDKWKNPRKPDIVPEEIVLPPEARNYEYEEDELYDCYFTGNKKKELSVTDPKSSPKVSKYSGQVKVNKIANITQVVLLDRIGEKRYYKCYKDVDVNDFPTDQMRNTLHRHRVDNDKVSDDAIIKEGIRIGLNTLGEYLKKHGRKYSSHSAETNRAVRETNKEKSVTNQIRSGKSFKNNDCYEPSSDDNDESIEPICSKKPSVKLRPNEQIRRGKSSDKLCLSESKMLENTSEISKTKIYNVSGGRSLHKRSVSCGKKDKEVVKNAF